MNRFLPIGSVILLTGYKEEILIIGYNSIKKDNSKFDYLGVMMPFGFYNHEEYITFNKDDIENILFVGDLNPLSKKYLNDLDKEGN